MADEWGPPLFNPGEQTSGPGPRARSQRQSGKPSLPKVQNHGCLPRM